MQPNPPRATDRTLAVGAVGGATSRIWGNWSWPAGRVGLLVVLVIAVGQGFASSAIALTPVSGSPFATGADPYSLAFSPDGALLATANPNSDNVSMFLVNQGSNALTRVPGSPFSAGDAPGSGSGPQTLAFSPAGDLLATADGTTVAVFSVNGTSGALTPWSGSPFATASQPFSVAFSPGGELLATGNLNGTVSMFSVDPASQALTQMPGSPFATGADPYSIAFSPSGALLATANNGDNTVSVFSVKQSSGDLARVSGSPFRTGVGPLSVAFSPAGDLLATANGAGTVSVFSVHTASGTLTPVARSPFATRLSPQSVAFSPGGRLLAAAGGGVALFSVRQPSGALTRVSGSPLATGSGAHAVAFSPSGALLASANYGSLTVSVFSVDASGGSGCAAAHNVVEKYDELERRVDRETKLAKRVIDSAKDIYDEIPKQGLDAQQDVALDVIDRNLNKALGQIKRAETNLASGLWSKATIFEREWAAKSAAVLRLLGKPFLKAVSVVNDVKMAYTLGRLGAIDVLLSRDLGRVIVKCCGSGIEE